MLSFYCSGVCTRADQTGLQIVQDLLDITLFSRGEKAWVHICQPEGRLNRDTTLAADQPGPSILDRLDDIRLDGHHPACRALFGGYHTDHVRTSGTDISHQVRSGNIWIEIDRLYLVLQYQNICVGIIVGWILFRTDLEILRVRPIIKIYGPTSTTTKFHSGGISIQ